MVVFYDSGWKSFSQDENVPVQINHNLGITNPVVSFIGRFNGQTGFPTIRGANDIPISGPYIEGLTHPTQLLVYKPDSYTFTGEFRIIIYG